MSNDRNRQAINISRTSTPQLAIRVEGLSKLYRIGPRQAGYRTLRETVSDLSSAPFRRLFGRNGRVEKRMSSVENQNKISTLRVQKAAIGDQIPPIINASLSQHSCSHSPLTTSHSLDSIWALKDVYFEVQPGEVVGVIGRNGAGKSTLLKILSRITEPTAGRVDINGRVASLLEVGTGFHPELTGRENVYLNGSILGMAKREVTRKFDEIVAFAEIEKFIDTPVKRYSSGMQVRLAFAVAAHLEPEILLVDEVLAVGDAQFQRKCIGKIHDRATGGRTVLIVSHHMHVIRNLCQRAILLNGGRVELAGSSREVVAHYLKSGNSSPSRFVYDEAEAPSTDAMRLIAAGILDPHGRPAAVVEIDKEIGIEIIFDVFQDIPRGYAALWLKDAAGTEVLSSVNQPFVTCTPDDFCGRPMPSGRYRSVCKIPANFLNAGHYFVTPIVGLDVSRTQVLLRDALTFEVADTSDMRTEYQNSWLGVVRPKLAWSTERSPVDLVPPADLLLTRGNENG